jgi:glutathione-regulated potassium-efflux system protein KefB
MGNANAILTAIIIISMVLTPFAMMALKRFGPRGEQVSLDGVELADGLHGSVLVIGFGRFGQIAASLCCCAASMSRSSTTMSR